MEDGQLRLRDEKEGNNNGFIDQVTSERQETLRDERGKEDKKRKREIKWMKENRKGQQFRCSDCIDGKKEMKETKKDSP